MKRKILIFICILFLLYFCYDLYLIYFKTTNYDYLQDYIITPQVEETIQDFKTNNESAEPIVEEKTLELYQIVYDWNNLYDLNNDIKGWLYINDKINYPVLQASDNNYYLRKNFKKEYDINGSLFFDYKVNDNSKNKVIHGHNMGSTKDIMFSLLDDYFDDIEYINENPYIFYTPAYGNTEKYELAYIIHLNIKDIEKVNYLKQNFVSEKEFNEWLEIMSSNSYYSNNININFNDNLLTLSTCDTRFYTNGRYVLIFKQI